MRRNVLRFIDHEEADRAASAIKGVGRVEEEPLLRLGEVPLRVRYLVPKRLKLLILILPAFLVPLMGVVLLLTLPAIGFLPWVILILPIIFFRWPYIILFGRLMRRLDEQTIADPRRGRLTSSYDGWLISDEKALGLRTNHGRLELAPEEISWNDSKTLVISSVDRRVYLEFRSPEEAGNAFEIIMTHYRQPRLVAP